MKILSSSPYAVFNSKDWNSIKSNIKPMNSKTPVKLQKKFYKNYQRLEYIEVSQENNLEPKLVQLSFA